ncbi:hypothetical protein PFLCHA0_c22130 [Pseudomonas protegens CHA0]|uniref:Uncharacterized protein n=1 Tax=Pseudomonas protegens (strain DSM 19095 / LMG 27888 / CFBP 6595 / CHA0) TaxID=1124983 RepID=A0A2C9EK11_PSEPH|nr:hypothetical protein PFLCHA0_c22130 [Pseudomonas protegens CHA0]
MQSLVGAGLPAKAPARSPPDPRAHSPASRLLRISSRHAVRCRSWLASEGARKITAPSKGLLAGKPAPTVGVG